MTNANKIPFYEFIDNTRISCAITGLGLFVIIWSFIGPGRLMFGNTIGKLIGLFILCYSAYNCLYNTQKYTQKIPEVFKDPTMTVERNNVLLSYGFSILLILLCVYIIKKLIW